MWAMVRLLNRRSVASRPLFCDNRRFARIRHPCLDDLPQIVLEYRWPMRIFQHQLLRQPLLHETRLVYDLQRRSFLETVGQDRQAAAIRFVLAGRKENYFNSFDRMNHAPEHLRGRFVTLDLARLCPNNRSRAQPRRAGDHHGRRTRDD